MTPSAILDEVLTKTGYEQYIRENGSMERLDNLSELKRMTVARERDWGETYPLDLYLQQIAVESAEREEESDAVRLMTIHAAKGLEFPVCFVCGMSEGVFPSARTLEERKEAGLEEERRLCFVALTRAMQRLYMTESEGTSIGQGKSAVNVRPDSSLKWERKITPALASYRRNCIPEMRKRKKMKEQTTKFARSAMWYSMRFSDEGP